ncbi:MAG: response regulator [Candidatus Methylomirabilia bacterium]
MPVRVLLVDDHPTFREGLAALLEARGEFQVVGQANSGEEAQSLARSRRPDLILMDVRMPGIGGLEATRRIRAELPGVRIVMLTVSDDEADLFEAVKSGAQGYLLKNMTSSDVLDLLRRAAGGEAAFTPALASKVLLVLGDPAKLGASEKLSQREHDVLEQLVQGQSNAAIARALGLSETTVRFHLRNILSKLHAQSRTEAAVQAVSRGLVPPPRPSEGH